MYYKSPSYRLFNFLNILFLSLISIACILPIVHVLAVSISDSAPVTANLVNFWPIGFNLDNYAKTFNSPNFLDAFTVSIIRTVLGTFISMLLCFTAAYSMSKDDLYFRGRTFYAWFFIITILFNGGLIPTYIVVVETGIKNTIWSLILPGAVAVFNVVLMMNFFRGIPKELDEAAQIDGATHFRTLFQIYLPISMPSIATLSLFTIVGHWNSWFDGMIYMEADKQPLATMIQALVKNMDFTRVQLNPQDIKDLSERGLKATQIFLGALPVLVAYPFLQKYFVKGMTLGSVKE
ncbi:ABC transporter permease [Paenibacillus swuensis]|uniref:ABC transporter permease n=1 Tax=Paenibacillus swuensis TaxID=1178515 RepID=A0A172TNG1_9BACL|nr:carbohydrate ABC transporter permease [Paenibacillus swuensis]ANE48591.1 ABC transporter permease [Paenibacillus swuensis]